MLARNPYSMLSLIAWLETQPADKEYDYNNIEGGCLIAQYLVAQGIDWIEYYHFATHSSRHYVASATPQTFGAALQRAREVAAQ